MTAIILAGGKSSRMRKDKAFIEIGGMPLIKRQLKLLKRIFKKIIIVTNNTHKSRSFYNMIGSLSKKGRDKYEFKGTKIVKDIIPDRGPLGGIYSGLMATNTFYNFVIACDMPFINLELIKYMISEKSGFDVVVPRIKKGYETLFAIYSKNCIKPISKILNSDNFRVRQIFNKVRLKEVSEEKIAKFANPSILFMNINTPVDLCKITTHLKEQKF